MHITNRIIRPTCLNILLFYFITIQRPVKMLLRLQHENLHMTSLWFRFIFNRVATHIYDYIYTICTLFGVLRLSTIAIIRVIWLNTNNVITTKANWPI